MTPRCTMMREKVKTLAGSIRPLTSRLTSGVPPEPPEVEPTSLGEAPVSHRSRKLAVVPLVVAAALTTTPASSGAAAASSTAAATYGDTLTPTTADAADRPTTYPSLREWQARAGSWSLTARS